MAAINCSAAKIGPRLAGNSPCTRALLYPKIRTHRTGRSAQPPAALLAGLLEKLPFLPQRSGGGGSASTAARRRLLEQLGSERPDKVAIGAACDELMAAQVPFKEADLGGGPWQVVYTRGPLLWQGLAAPSGGRVVQPTDNLASQDFDPSSRRVVNFGQLLGEAVTVTASGRYEPQAQQEAARSGGASSGSGSSAGKRPGGGRCPVRVRASIEGGGLRAWGVELPLPIRGSGLVDVAYLDPRGLRIFRALNGSISVQMRQPPRGK